MTLYAREDEDGTVHVGLPRSGVLRDGRTVSHYDNQPVEVLREEGWLEVDESVAVPDPALCEVIEVNYERVGDRFVPTYRTQPRPPSLVVDRTSIPPDDETAAFVTYRDPSLIGEGGEVELLVNDRAITLDIDPEDGEAILEVTAAHEGVVEVFSSDELRVIINVEEE